MNTRVEVLEDQVAKLNAVIEAAEDWATSYGKDPKTHAKLIAAQNKLERNLRDYLRDLAARVPKRYINWPAYNQHLITKRASSTIRADDFNINIIFDGDLFDDEEPTVFQAAIHDPILAGVTAGANAGENIYNRPIGMTSSFQSIVDAARQQSASLVGKKVLKNGNVVDNPNANMNVTGTTRKLIQRSIATSIQLNEKQDQAIARLQSSAGIKDYARAEMIARTEAVRSYTNGIHAFGTESGATGKEWIVSGDPCDICAPLDGEKKNIDEPYSSGDDGPPPHVNCRCGDRLMYANEWPGDMPSSTDDGSGS